MLAFIVHSYVSVSPQQPHLCPIRALSALRSFNFRDQPHLGSHQHSPPMGPGTLFKLSPKHKDLVWAVLEPHLFCLCLGGTCAVGGWCPVFCCSCMYSLGELWWFIADPGLTLLVGVVICILFFLLCWDRVELFELVRRCCLVLLAGPVLVGNFPSVVGMSLISCLALIPEKGPDSPMGECQYCKLKLFNYGQNFGGDTSGTILNFIAGFSVTQGDMDVFSSYQKKGKSLWTAVWAPGYCFSNTLYYV